MAKVQFGSGVAAISGRTAGTVFARNKGGAYMRRFSKPTNPGSPAQDIARNRLSTASSFWKTMTQPMRDAWNAYALTHPVLDRLGASIILTGHQAFVKVSANLLLMGEIIVPETPADPVFFNPVIRATGSTFTAETGVLVLKAGCLLETNSKFALWGSPPVSPGITNTQSQERFLKNVAVVAETAAGATIAEVTGAEYIAVFGDISTSAGKAVTLSAYPYDVGQFGQRASAKLVLA
jgi:hypothetical protein